jgi:hypothetical protein
MTTTQQMLSMSFFSGGIGMFYTLLCSKLDGLMGTFHSSKIFPAAARQAGGAGSRNALRSSQKRLRESHARHNHAIHA